MENHYSLTKKEETIKMLGIALQHQTYKDILEQIQKYIDQRTDFVHIVSLNPENLVVAQKNQQFKDVLNQAQIRIVDGVGVAVAARMVGMDPGERITGVDLMQKIIELAYEKGLSVLLIGGKPDLADELAKCYSQEAVVRSSTAKFMGINGIKDIQNPQQIELNAIYSIVTDRRPHIILAAFGSPAQELWLASNQPHFQGIVCMGVGGSFDFAAGKIPRAPMWMRSAGLEWLFRLVVQPWRWKRQLRLLQFIYLVIREKVK